MASNGKKNSRARAFANGTANATAGVAGSILRVLGTALLILVVTGLLFMCIFAYYVKTCLSTQLDVQLEDFKYNRIYVRDIDLGKDLQLQIDNLQKLLIAYRHGIIKEK